MPSKRLLLSLAAGLCVGTAALAQESDNFLTCHAPLEEGTFVVDLGVVGAAADGVVRVYDYAHRQKGDLLGEAPVHAGSNDVRIRTDRVVLEPVLAELLVGDAVVDSRVMNVCDPDH